MTDEASKKTKEALTELYKIGLEISRLADRVGAISVVINSLLNDRGEFLAELSANDHKYIAANGEHEVAYIAMPPLIPTDVELDKMAAILFNDEMKAISEKGTSPIEQTPLVEQVAEMLGMGKTGETPLMPQERFEKLCAYVLKGHENGMDVSEQWVTTSLMNQGLAITSKQEEYLSELRKIKAQFLSKDLDLKQASGQVQSEAEKTALVGLAAKHNLK